MTTARELIGRPAIVSSYLAPVLLIGGTLLAGALTPGYDPVRQTISELAAGDAPTRVLMTVFFVLTGLCHLVTVTFARGIGIAGRIVFLIGAVATLGVAAFPLPSVAGSSATHTAFAMIGFIALAAWPLLGMRLRTDFPWLVRPFGSILGTAILTALCVWFLIIWSSHSSPVVGLVERFAADAESLWPAVVATALFRRARRLAGQTRALPHPTTVARLLTGTLLSATFGALFFVLSVFMSHESNTYVPAIAIAIACAAAFVGFFIAYLVASTRKR